MNHLWNGLWRAATVGGDMRRSPMGFVKTLVKGAVVAKLAQIAQRELSKPENQRKLKEAFQKGLRGLEIDRSGWVRGETAADDRLRDTSPEAVLAAIRTPTPERIFQIKYSLELGIGVDAIAERTGIDPWFLYQLSELLEAEGEWKGSGEGGKRAGER